MTDAVRDQNHVPVHLGVLCTDGVTLVPIAIDGSGNVKVDSVSTLLVPVNPIALRDRNHVPCWMGTSSVDDTPVPIYVNADGAILIEN